jgi:hypothetical protein
MTDVDLSTSLYLNDAGINETIKLHADLTVSQLLQLLL